jgi:hypothetical protein
MTGSQLIALLDEGQSKLEISGDAIKVVSRVLRTDGKGDDLCPVVLARTGQDMRRLERERQSGGPRFDRARPVGIPLPGANAAIVKGGIRMSHGRGSPMVRAQK